MTDRVNAEPLFSIVIPMFNREEQILRALDSCLLQDFDDFEVIVVDDASTDGSTQVVTDKDDARIRLIRHEKNRGVCPARNTGVDNAAGEWIIFLDSDDELLPGALRRIARHIETTPPEIARLAFMYEIEDGGASPDPALEDEILDYNAYLQWFERAIRSSDFNNCIRRKTFALVKLPDNRAYEAIYHLDFARQYLTHTIPEKVARIHRDAANSSTGHSVKRMLRDACDGAASMEELLDRHGAALWQYAPMAYHAFLKLAASYHFLAGERALGARRGWQYLRKLPISPEGWLVLICGAINPQMLAYAKLIKSRLVRSLQQA